MGIPGGALLAGCALRWIYQIHMRNEAIEIRPFGQFAPSTIPFTQIESIRKTRGWRDVLKAFPTCLGALRLTARGLRMPDGIVLTLKTNLRSTFPPGVLGRLLILFPSDPDAFVDEVKRRMSGSAR